MSRQYTQHSFNTIPKAEIQRSKFDRSHGHKTTFNAPYLIPIRVDECLPGDTINIKSQSFVRLATPIHPFMDTLYIDEFWFAVPYRLLWYQFKEFMGEQADPGDPIDFTIPKLTTPVGGHDSLTMADYFGLPLNQDHEDVNALPFRAMNLIWNEWFRDENIQDSIPVNILGGPDNIGMYPLQKRGRRKDYFGSALPWPQKGDAVQLPLGTSAPIIPNPSQPIPKFDVGSGSDFLTNPSGTEANLNVGSGAGNPLAWGAVSGDTGLLVDLSQATAATINQIREAFQIQRLFERDARGGTRYTEIIRSHFGVTSPDSRLQRPELLGTSTQKIGVTPVPQTSQSADTAQGNLAGYSVTTGGGANFTHSFTEHCVLIGLASVRSELTYQQGLHRMWTRNEREEFYWPALANLGEQAILQKEIFCDGSPEDQDVFGYIPRYDEYRHMQSKITGVFRSEHPTPLDPWHLAEHFDSAPTLDPAFIQMDPPIERVIAVETEPHFLGDWWFTETWARPMPTYSVPGLVDHF